MHFSQTSFCATLTIFSAWCEGAFFRCKASEQWYHFSQTIFCDTLTIFSVWYEGDFCQKQGKDTKAKPWCLCLASDKSPLHIRLLTCWSFSSFQSASSKVSSLFLLKSHVLFVLFSIDCLNAKIFSSWITLWFLEFYPQFCLQEVNCSTHVFMSANLFTDKSSISQIDFGKEGGGGFGWLRGLRCFHNRGSSAQNFHIASDLAAQQARRR